MATSAQGEDFFENIARKFPDNLVTFIRKVEGQGKAILELDDINRIRKSTDGFFSWLETKLGKRSTEDDDFSMFLNSVREVLVSSPCVVISASLPDGSLEYARVTSSNPVAIEKLTESEYEMYKEELVIRKEARAKEVDPYSTLSEAIWSVTQTFLKNKGSPSMKPKEKNYVDIVIFSSHGFFSDAERYCNAKDQAKYILKQVRGLEKEILKCSKQLKLYITPRIYIVNQLLPETSGPSLYKKLEDAKNAHVIQFKISDNKGIFHRWSTAEFNLLTQDIKDVTDRVLDRSPVLIIGSDRDGNQRASLLANAIGARWIDGAGHKFAEASWTGGARKFFRGVKKIQKD